MYKINTMIKELRKLESEGLITLRGHDKLPLLIANYTPEVQYERLWDEYELLKQCRGLIIDENGKVIARPFEKFFNYQEHKEFDSLPDIPVDKWCNVTKKYDGSLGIIFWYEGKWRTSTRGSFHSEQADKARELLKNYETEKMDKEYTYLVEILYPENRIVVRQDEEKLVLLTKIRTKDGAEELRLEKGHKSNANFPLARTYPFDDIDEILHIFGDKSGEELEGFVLHYENGLRIKIKLEDYVRLHRLLTGLTKRKIWELVKDEEDIEELYKTAPDEVYDWVKETANELELKFKNLKKSSIVIFNNIYKNVRRENEEFSRKKFALRVTSNETIDKLQLKGVMFDLLDGNSIDDKIWRIIYPDHETP